MGWNSVILPRKLKDIRRHKARQKSIRKLQANSHKNLKFTTCVQSKMGKCRATNVVHECRASLPMLTTMRMRGLFHEHKRGNSRWATQHGTRLSCRRKYNKSMGDKKKTCGVQCTEKKPRRVRAKNKDAKTPRCGKNLCKTTHNCFRYRTQWKHRDAGHDFLTYIVKQLDIEDSTPRKKTETRTKKKKIDSTAKTTRTTGHSFT